MYTVLTAYQFITIDKDLLPTLKEKIEQAGKTHGIEGLILISTEGTNFTYAGSEEGILNFTPQLQTILGAKPFVSKTSYSEIRPFKRLTVDVRNEIVTFDGKFYQGVEAPGTHLSPQDWHKTLTTEKVLMVDVRNKYETAVGMFRGALDPDTQCFSEFVDFLKKWDVPRDQKILTYCTGGVRCEKAVVEMQRQGYSNVYQLEGGILNYLKHYPEGEFVGECFVFDHRVSVDGHLEPSKIYKLCPHCGNAGDQTINCGECNKVAVICASCAKDAALNSCSKNCTYHLRRKAQKAA